MSDLYQTQRAMRGIRQAALQRGVVAVLDIGTTKIACMVLRFEPDLELRDDGVGPMAGQANFRVIGSATTRSRGVRFGEIDTMAETERAVRTAIQQAQKMAEQRVDHVIVGFSGGRPSSYGLAGEVEITSGKVREADIGRVLAACEIPPIGAGREVLHAQPVNFTLDHRTGLADPREHSGNRLGVDMHLLTVDQAVLENIAYCIKRCDLELAGIASSSYAAGLAAIVEDDRELGGACIDMGGGSTGVSVFMKRHLIFADNVRMGGAHVTADIAAGLHIPENAAERIKTLNGGVLATGKDDREYIDLGGDDPDWASERRRVSRGDLIAIMRPRVEEILEEVRSILDAAGFDKMPHQQIFLTGGACQIPGLDGLAARILGQNIRIGRPLRVQGMPHSLSGPSFAATVGLALWAAQPQDECWDFDLPAERYPAGSLRRAIRWFRNNW